MGEYKYRDIVIPDGIPVIVSKPLFDRVQERMEKTKNLRLKEKPKTIIC